MSKIGSVLFIIHDLYQDDNHFPLGIGYLAAVLRKKDVDVEVCCQDIFHYTNEELTEVLKKRNYDLICVGFLAARFQETVLDLCKCINKHKKSAWLVLGGHGPSPIPEYVLEQTHADAIVIGEGEESLPDLLKCKLDGGDPRKIKGIAYMENGVPNVTPRRKPVHDLDSIPFPEWSLFPIEEYIKSLKLFRYQPEDRCFGMLTSRGCINRCNINYFLMNDELFVYPKKRIFEFRDELEKTDLKIKFVCNARVDVFDEEVAGCLKEVGCQFLNFGMESSDQKVLDLMNKHTTVEENIRAAEIAKKAEIGLGLNFIWGNIGDTAESLKNNTALIKKYTTYDYIRTIRPVTPYPGCDLYYEAIKRGLLESPDDFFKKFKNSDLLLVNFTEISEKKFYELLFAANKDLILDYYEHTAKDMDAANKLIDDFYRLYFEGETRFRGARHYKTEKE
ncbi:MAG: radical SAM protein [Methanoregula sp.]|nr:radical SAM protein [Methanoregula sp.]